MKGKVLCLGLALIFNQPAVDAVVLQDYEDSKGWSAVCPDGFDSQPDSWNFATCNCTSYVAWRLNRQWQSIAPSNSIPFTNQYRDSEIHTSSLIPARKWGNARYWGHVAEDLGVAVNHVPTVGSVGWRNANEFGAVSAGHVFFVEVVEGDRIKISEYNGEGTHQYRETWIDADQASGYIHLTASHLQYIQTHQYGSEAYWEVMNHIWECEDMGNICPIGGEGGGEVNSSISYNLNQDTDILDPSTGQEFIAGTATLKPSQTVNIRVKLISEGGDVRNYMDPGKDTIETDFYVRLDSGEWTFYRRVYTRAYNLGSGTKNETVSYVVPGGISEISFRVQVDAEDEVNESKEGDNWSRIETFRVNRRNAQERKRFLRNIMQIIND